MAVPIFIYISKYFVVAFLYFARQTTALVIAIRFIIIITLS